MGQTMTQVYTDIKGQCSTSLHPVLKRSPPLLPTYGTMRPAYHGIRDLSNLLEQISNNTADALGQITTEMAAIRTVALQNRMALEYM
ncbi:hypothetical protein FKM82_030631 [Ascaphus truei]